MRYSGLVASIAVLLFTSVNGMGAYDDDWITRVRLPLSMINRIFGLLNFDPLSTQDKSEALFGQLKALETFQTFMAVQGFGYAFQDQLGTLQDNIATPVTDIQTSLTKFLGENIDKKIVSFFGDIQCADRFEISMITLRNAYSALIDLI